MSSASLVSSLVILMGLMVFDIFCADLTNLRLSNLPLPRENTQQKSTTPWPVLKDRWTIPPRPQNNLRRPPTGTASKWIQQNNIWIRNEQAIAEGQDAQNVPNSSSTTPKNTRRQNNRPSTPASVPNFSNIAPKSSQNQENTQNVPHPSSTTPKNTQRLNNRYSTPASVPNFGNTMPKSPQNNQNHNLWGPTRGQNTQNIHDTANNNFPTLSTPRNQAGVSTTQTRVHPTPSRQNSWAEIVKGGANPGSSTPKTAFPLPTKGPNKNTDTENNFGNQNVDNLQVSDSPVTDDELREFSETLLKRDVNNAAKYVNVNLQSMTSSRSEEDKAPEPLLQIDQEAYKIPSIEKLVLLHNNYFLEASQNEVHTGAERIEENDLLDSVINTPAMQYARTFLMQKGKIGKDPKEFRDILKLIWFNMYSRGQGRIGSSGFEHVFVAELKNNQVSGLHNWLYFSEEEKNQRANYLGYLKKLDLGNKGAILKYHFTFHGVDKPVGSMFIGTSPELEMALYSTCFLLRADRICPLKMNDHRFIIRTYTYRYRGKDMIGSAFPEI